MYRAGRISPAIDVLREALKLSPNSRDVRKSLGMLLLENNKIMEASSLYDETVRMFPDGAYLGRVYARQGKTREAAAQFTEAIRHNPGHAKAQFELGQLMLEMNRFAIAVGQFEGVLRMDPDNADAHYGIAPRLPKSVGVRGGVALSRSDMAKTRLAQRSK